MGICNTVMLPKVEAIIDSISKTTSKIRMIELGDQVFNEGGHSKEHYMSLVDEHVYIDTNGTHGSLELDLREKIDIEPAHLVTNHGTTEHVEGVEGQIACFENIHNMCAIGGYMIHSVPLPGTWSGHGSYKYPLEFFEILAKNNNYNVLENRTLDEGVYTGPKNLSWCVLQKIEDTKFVSDNLTLHIL